MPYTPFYEATSRALDRFTALFDSSWFVLLAVERLHAEVHQRLAADPSRTIHETGRSILGASTLRANAFGKTVKAMTVRDHFSRLAWTFLGEIVGIYEAWCEDLAAEVPLSGSACSQLQQPSTHKSGGVPALVTSIVKNTSSWLSACVGAVGRKHKWFDAQHLDQCLFVYRYWKECRNAHFHRGDKADKKVLKAAGELAPLASSPRYIQHAVSGVGTPRLGQELIVSERDIISLSHVMMHVVLTIDVLCVETRWAEGHIERRWKQRIPNHRRDLPGEADRRDRRLRQFFRKVGVLEVAAIRTTESWLRKLGLTRS